MPSPQPIPTVAQLVQVAVGPPRGDRPSGILQGEINVYGDGRSGSFYNHAAGPMAILYSRESQRDRDLFADIYFDDASDEALTRLVQGRTGITRILDTFGTGVAVFARANATAGSGTITRGTRIQVGGTTPATYQVARDTAVSGTTSTPVPIVATKLGIGTAIATTSGLSLTDPVYDPLWLPVSLTCGDGTTFEKAADYRARVRATRTQTRRGYIPSFVTTCLAAGATHVIGFPSTFGLDPNNTTSFASDVGLSAVYVADSNFQSSSTLVNACLVALEGQRVLGCDLWVGGVVQTPIELSALVSLTDNPGKLPQAIIRNACTQAALGLLGGSSSGFALKRASIGGAMSQASGFVQTVNWTDVTGGQYPNTGVYINGVIQSTDPVLSAGSFPATLPRYTLAPNDISLVLIGPL